MPKSSRENLLRLEATDRLLSTCSEAHVVCMQAAELQKEGWTIVDVRVANKYEKSHIEGSVSIPLFRPVEGDSMFDNVKRFVRHPMQHAFNHLGYCIMNIPACSLRVKTINAAEMCDIVFGCVFVSSF